MKTSNKIVILIAATLVAANVIYDIAIKREYATGNYKRPFADFASLPYQNFNKIMINPASMITVKLVQGPFKVLVRNTVKDVLAIKQIDHSLVIDLNWRNARYNSGRDIAVLISCPVLKSVKAGATYTLNKVKYTDTIAVDDWSDHHLLVEGFKQDSLNLVQEWGSKVVLQNNVLAYFHANTGNNKESSPKLTIQRNNILNHADFEINDKSRLILSEARIKTVNYHLADSASLTVNGAATRSINKQIP
ncbi:hypothetical protein AAFN85_16185 [Mucilaginibacter sp. CAU 1740]|uniref:hypothetical protein n=1 Tax=Mucilaginibacter sp. CAU 1740 TaxID=3140365 RepID=UPI00325B9CF2